MRSSRRPARAAIFFGALAVLAVAAAVAAAQVEKSVRLLDALYVGVPVSAACGLIAVLCSRRARFRLASSLHPERRRLVRAARLVAWLGLYVGITSALALGVYGVLRAAS